MSLIRSDGYTRFHPDFIRDIRTLTLPIQYSRHRKLPAIIGRDLVALPDRPQRLLGSVTHKNWRIASHTHHEDLRRARLQPGEKVVDVPLPLAVPRQLAVSVF